jgi:hypothetical protein
MVNELAKKWGNRIKFVDDLTAAEIIPRNSPSLLDMIVEEEIHQYAVTNRMKLNPRKCKEMLTNFMTYYNIACRPLVINSMVVERVNSYKLLGLIINNTLSWCEHSLEKCKRGSKRLFGLRQLKQAGINHKDIVMVYCTTIRPTLEYASPAWLNIPLYISTNLRMSKDGHCALFTQRQNTKTPNESLDSLCYQTVGTPYAKNI